eukprot:457493-Prymnesium_polylepis.1
MDASLILRLLALSHVPQPRDCGRKLRACCRADELSGLCRDGLCVRARESKNCVRLHNEAKIERNVTPPSRFSSYVTP